MLSTVPLFTWMFSVLATESCQATMKYQVAVAGDPNELASNVTRLVPSLDTSMRNLSAPFPKYKLYSRLVPVVEYFETMERLVPFVSR